MFKKAFKKNLIAGLLVTIPAGLTYMILSFVITRVDRAMAPAIKGIFGSQGLYLMEKSVSYTHLTLPTKRIV